MRGDVAPKATKLLEALDMAPDPVTCPGLVRADSATLAEKRRAKASLEEIVAIERAITLEVDYVYFRRFLERPAMATAYIYDWTGRLGEARRSPERGRPSLSKEVEEKLADLHRRFWSACEVPLVYIFLPTEVQIYHILKGPREVETGIEHAPWKVIELGEEIAGALEELHRFSARRLDDGTFWEEDPEARELELGGAAFMQLSQELAACRDTLVLTHGIPDKLVRRLVILFVLVKYLEERKDPQGNGVFPDGTFAFFAPNARNIVDLLRAGGGGALAFFDSLARGDRFNGDVFLLDATEREALLDTNLLRLFADLLEAKTEGSQRTFWRRYAFNELPVELISHLYEQFLPRQRGVVYTPPFLVSFILNEVLPLSEDTPPSFRLIDPACGSGVFLVGAFRRLVHRWRKNNDYAYPDVDTLKRILRDHVFGVDIEGEAVRLTMFSLSVALCDFLQPRVIWHDLHFDRLKDTNLIEGDFFHHVKSGRWQGTDAFDLVVGNPPFVSDFSTRAGEHLARDLKSLEGFDIPDKQVALLFLGCATRITKPEGQIALIEPSGPLLYNEGSSRFRGPFLARTHVSQIVDLTHLSRVLFKRPSSGKAKSTERASTNPGDVAVAVVFAEKREPDDSPLLHVTVRRTVQAEQKLLFEIDHYDLHFVPRQEAREDPKIWKANFIGGGRVLRLLRRLDGVGRLGDFLKRAKRTRRWVASEGYTAGKEAKSVRREALSAKEEAGTLTRAERSELEALKKRYREGSWLTDHRVLPTEAFTSAGIDRSKEVPIRQKFFAEPRQEELFSGPLLLIKNVIEADTGRIPVALSSEGVRFLHSIYGIHAPISDLSDLVRIRDLISNNKLVLFHLLANSSRYLVNKSSAIKTGDLKSLPFPRSTSSLRFSPVEDALMDDALEHVAEFKRKGERSAAHRKPSDDDLLRFGEFFCMVLGAVYPTLKRDAPVSFADGICYPFYFGEKPTACIDDSEAGGRRLEKLLTTIVGPSLRCQRILRVFSGNMLLLVKPAQLRYWLRSIAVRDADELFVELQERGY